MKGGLFMSLKSKWFVTIIVLTLMVFSFSVFGTSYAAGSEKVQVIIVFNDKDAGLNALNSQGFQQKFDYDIIPGVSGSLTRNAIGALQNNPNIDYIVEDGPVSIAAQTTPWGVDRIDADKVWSTSTGDGVDIAILDTGLDRDHEDLADNVGGGIAYVDAKGKNSYNWFDDNGHGSHVAGTIAAVDNSLGVKGVAPSATIYGVKVLNHRGSGSWSDFVAGVNWAKNNGMDIVSMSLSGGFNQAAKDAVDAAETAGLVLIGAAGNDGSAVDYPAKYDSVIAVSATNSNDGYPSWSNYGPEIIVSAPGVSIYSTYKNGGYTTMSGTSMATPHVTGVAALILADDPNADVKQTLIDSAEDLGPAGFDNHYGYGLVDAEAALGPVTPDEEPPVISNVATSGITHNSATITWTTDELSNSVVNYGTSGSFGITESNSAMVTSHSIILTGLLPETTYYFEVRSTDGSNNEATHNTGDSFTTTSTPQGQYMHVSDITMWSENKGPNLWVYTRIIIVDDSDIPVSEAEVDLQMTLPGGSQPIGTGTTDTNGIVTFRLRTSGSGTFISVVTDVVKTDWIYDSAANVETSDSLTV
jgi:subtilisin